MFNIYDKYSFSKKLFISIATMIVISTMIIGIFTISYFYRKIRVEALNKLEKNLQASNFIIESFNNEIQDFTNTLSQNMTLKLFVRHDISNKLTEYITRILYREKKYQISVINNYMVPTVSLTLNNSPLSNLKNGGIKFSSSIIESSMKGKRRIGFELINIGQNGNDEFILCISSTSPIIDNNDVISVLLTRKVLNNYIPFFTNINSILDVKSNIFVNRKSIINEESISERIQEKIKRNSGIYYEKNYKWNGNVSIYKKLYDYEGKETGILSLTINTRENYISVIIAIFSILFIMFFLLIIAYLYSIYTSNKMMTPINQLISSINSIINGDLNYPILINEKDEIGLLAEAFDKMRLTIRDKINTIQNMNTNLEKKVTERTKTAEQANKFKSIFIANMSHEIRTPLSSILGYTDVLIENLSNEDMIKYAQNIKADGENLLKLLNDILDISKIEAGKLDFDYTPININTLINEMNNMFKKKCTEKGLRYICKKDTFLPDNFLLPEARIRQVLINVVNNAIKFTDKGFVRVSINGFNTSLYEKKYQLEIVIEDSGIGIPEENFSRIFENFQQLSSNRSGSGLGLSITKKIIDYIGGEISLNSKIGKGTVFKIILNDIEITDKAINIDNLSTNINNIDFKKTNILIVDDHKASRDLLKLILKPYNLKIYETESGYKATELVQKHSIDLILLDMRIPDFDGYEVARHIKNNEDTENIIIIAVTADALKTFEKEIKEAGCDEIVKKPFTKSDIILSLMHFLEYDKIETEEDIIENIDLLEIPIEDSISIENLEKLYYTLNKEYYEELKLISKKRILNELDSFVTIFKKLYEDYPITIIDIWSKRLTAAILSYDTNEIDNVIKDYEKILINLNNNIKNKKKSKL